MFTVEIVGMMGRFASAHGACSSYIFRTDSTTVIVDMGSGSLPKLLSKVKLAEIDAIIITHLHADHYSDLLTFDYRLGYYNALHHTDLHIPVYLPNEPIEAFANISKSNLFDYNIITDGLEAQIGDINFEFCKVVHPVPTYGIIASVGNKVISYTSDTVDFDNLHYIFDNADVVIGDACILDCDHTERCPHLSVKQLAQYMKTGKLVLSHLPDRNIEDVYDEAQEIYSDSVLAKEGDIY